MKIKIINIIVLVISFNSLVMSQEDYDTLPFINYNKNYIHINNSEAIKNIYEKLRNVNTQNSKPINIVHIGDSHLQAAFLTEKIKQNLFQNFYATDTIAAPGFIFPFTIAQTNNPFFYTINYTGNWDWCKNVDSEKECHLGLSGITIRTKDPSATLNIKMQNKKYDYPFPYYFDKIKILHNNNSSVVIKVNEKQVNHENNYSYVELENIVDSAQIEFTIDNSNKNFELYGIILENKSSKINYHTIGVNGAEAQSYLKCDYFSKHLSLINPDLIIISLGTNEAYDTDFSSIEHIYILKDLIFQIQDIVPNSTILFTTPNDHYKDNNPNKNVALVRNNILKVCSEFKLNYWDFYTIMGGENSIQEWYNYGLTGEDKLHFKRKAYEIQADLFCKALMNSFYDVE